MHVWMFHVLLIWHIALAVALAVFALRSRGDIVHCTLALDTLGPIVVSALAMIALYRAEAGFLDVALVIGMLGFVQAVAVARLVERRIRRDV